MATSNGSDGAVFEQICETCKEIGQSLPVEGFCVDCNDYLCKACVDYHRISRPSKHHVIKTGENMPSVKPSQAASKRVPFKCPVHDKKDATSFCKFHNQVCCEDCVTTGHIVCIDVKKISQGAKGITDGKEFLSFCEKLKSLKKVYTEKQNKAQSNLKQTDFYYNTAMAAFKDKLDKIKTNDTSKLKTITSTYESVIAQFTAWLKDIDACVSDKANDDLYLLMLRTQPQIDAIETNVNELCRDDDIVKYAFLPDGVSLGRLLNMPFLVGKINVKHERETKQCCIHSLRIFQDGFMLIADDSNKSLKVCQLDNNKITSHATFHLKPWQICVTDEMEAYVSLSRSKNILHFKSPTTDLSNFTEITVDGTCRTMEYVNEALVVQCESPAKLLKLDKGGKVVEVLCEDVSNLTTRNGESFVTNPKWSTRDLSTGSVYLSCNSGSITEVTVDGHIELFTKVKSPEGLCMDTDGSILVCSNSEKDVFKVGKGNWINSVLPEALDFKPSALALDAQRRLYVGGYANNNFYVFQI